MNIIGYIGQAGTGKTTKIIGELNSLSETIEWANHKAILALTFMHGSRRRLHGKLSSFAKNGIQIDCQTIDSFCLRLVQRYKRYLAITKVINISDFVEQTSFKESDNEIICGIDPIREYAIKILSFETVKKLIQSSYPVIVIDEFQDCDGLLLKFIKELAPLTKVLIAADDFQKLQKENEVCEAVDWLKSKAPINELTTIHRTNNDKILQTSKALRTNTFLAPGVDVLTVTSSALAAWNIAKYIGWENWGRGKSKLAIISPTKLETDAFFRETIKRLSQPFEKHGFPGTTVFIEGDNDITSNEILNNLAEWNKIETVEFSKLINWKNHSNPVIKQASIRALRLLNLRGEKDLPKQEFSELIGRQRHYHKVYGGNRFEYQKTALTVHQAKNREFDYVIVLWSYKNQGGNLYSRKLLYNAITRAQKDAVIIMQFNPTSEKKDSTIQLISNNYYMQPAKKVSKKKN